ncbi:iron chelate uptake ABC transporter family permease subunit [Sutterella sp.]|uniref:iron chelate uptake ABC transporter family permease subunit n=1 Tax=Sutterella sp. TaxID=1981025 RepID=UPI00283DE4E1|nr:iron chelate uptake ABC transporter family permease subunit [Sutterella sp.]MDR3968026.1 iron chelate uptake ABC transporter family permease subunit [Sutterella sp.]
MKTFSIGALIAAAAALGISILCTFTLDNALSWTDRVNLIFDPASAESFDAYYFAFGTLPRFAAAAIGGALLGLVGSLLQQLTQNPMTSPLTLGTSSGGWLAVVLISAFFPAAAGAWLSLGAFAGALAAFGLILLIAGPRGMTGVALIIAGMVVNLLFGAIATAVVLLRAQFVENVFLWGAGDLAQNGWGGITGAGFGTLAATILLYVPRRVLSFTKCMDGAVNGMKLMLPANIILVLAWTLSGICRDLLMSAQYVEGLVTSFGGDVMQLFPFICFAAACVLSFATGASWATFGILVPILVPIAYAVDPSMVFVVLGAVLAGSVFGDHSSPISDTSVLSAASSGCPVMEHAATQLPYALLTAFAAGAGYLVSGFTNGNLWVSWGTAVAVLGGGLWWFLSRQTDSVSAAVTVAKS